MAHPGQGHRLSFVFTLKHGSWLNLIAGFFSGAELKARILAYFDDVNRDPVIHRCA